MFVLEQPTEDSLEAQSARTAELGQCCSAYLVVAEEQESTETSSIDSDPKGSTTHLESSVAQSKATRFYNEKSLQMKSTMLD
jgi:hypothetical protein